MTTANWRARLTKLVDVFLYLFLFAQIFYVFEENELHEWLGIGFFACLIVHLVIKKWWFRQYLPGRKKTAKTSVRIFRNVLIWLLMLSSIILMLTSMDVSRSLFSGIHFWGSPFFHQLMATVVMVLSIVHGCMHGYEHAKNRKRACILICILAAAGVYLGMGLVPYLNRHFRIVNIDEKSVVSGEQLDTDRNIAVVYFTRVGNTDFEPDVDAVSGASLMLSGDELRGNTQLMAMMIENMISCDVYPITLTGEKYPSSYSGTVGVAGAELRRQDRPEIEPIDISGYDSVILVYPIWWGTIPMPVATFLESGDFSGKTVYLLATQGSIGFGGSTEDVQELIPDGNVVEGLSIYCDDIPTCREEIAQWLSSVLG